nr:unnamed protein product [Digitaria exilis]
MCGEDDVINVAFTWWLIVFLTLLCAVLSFTVSVRGKDGHTYYYGIATPWRLVLFNHNEDKRHELADVLASNKLGWKDFVHAVFSAAVFMTLAFCDAGVQSFVFTIFPSDRNGIGVETSPHPHKEPAGGQKPAPPPPPPPPKNNTGEHAPAAARLQQLQDLTTASARPRALGCVVPVAMMSSILSSELRCRQRRSQYTAAML